MAKITERDLQLLETVGNYELMTTSQIKARIFIGVDKKTVLRRLRKLEEEKLLKRTHGLQSGELVWSLAHFGAFRIGRDGFPENINRNSLEHDIKLCDLRLTLEKHGIATSWVTEQYLRRQLANDDNRFGKQLCPDAIFAVNTSSGYQGIAFELELSGKNASRYAKVFEAYGKRENYFAVWYVVDSEGLGAKLQREWNKVNSHIKRPQFGWMLLKDLLTEPQVAKLNCDSKAINLNSIIEMSHEEQEALNPKSSAQPPHPSAV